MEDARYKLHWRALLALNALSPLEQARVRDRLAAIVDLPAERWPAQGLPRLAADEPLYLLRVDDSLRVILRATPGAAPEILDVVRHETLERFRTAGDPAAQT